jgi:hypothetical protein
VRLLTLRRYDVWATIHRKRPGAAAGLSPARSGSRLAEIRNFLSCPSKTADDPRPYSDTRPLGLSGCC